MPRPLRILAIGAHPDDCEITCGGAAVLWRQLGHHVKFVSMTNGDAGHHRLSGSELATIRRDEATAAARVLDVESEVFNYRDGHLEPSLEARLELIAYIRIQRPDLILTHRPNDYHPDHRYTSQLVCDAAYLVTVPALVPEQRALRSNPVIMYVADSFQRPYPFTPDVVVDIEPVLETVVEALACHESQFFDWLAYNHSYEDELPAEPAARLKFLGEHYRKRIAEYADKFRELLNETYGEEHASSVKSIEAFELSEYGAGLSNEDIARLFPFLPGSS